MRATVHSALGWVPGEGPTHDEDDPLPCDLLIVDETSMANLELLVTLPRAVGQSTHVVLVGDADQLAPVGAGKPFAELIAAERCAHRSADPHLPPGGREHDRPGRARGPPRRRAGFPAGEGMRRDLFLIERADPRAAREEIVSLVSRPAARALRRGPGARHPGVRARLQGRPRDRRAQQALREALNPDGEPVRGGRLRIGDKLMLTGRNLHELGLMNGTLLRCWTKRGDGQRRRCGADPAEESVFGFRRRSPIGCGWPTRARFIGVRGSSCRWR